MSASSLHPIAEQLPDFRYLIPDMRGHSMNRDVPFSGIDRCADDIASIIAREAHGLVHIFGLSPGGYVAMQLRRIAKCQSGEALVRAHRGPATKGLGLVTTRPRLQTPEKGQTCEVNTPTLT